jgi:hypothetical protein
MTIAFGVACEDGALLVTDSMAQHHRAGGWIDADLSSRKFVRLGERWAMVVSGLVTADYAPDVGLVDESIETLTEVILGELRLLEKSGASSPGGLRRHTDLLVGGGLVPDVVLVTTGSVAGLKASRGGAPLVGGAMGSWAREEGIKFGLAPRRLEHAIPFALLCCRRYIRESWRAWGFERYEDFHAGEPGGHVPPSAPPYQLAVITDHIETLEVAE